MHVNVNENSPTVLSWLSCSPHLCVSQYVCVFITSGFEFERAEGGRVLQGDLAGIWGDEEMKAREDERWFEEGKISPG